MRTLRVDSTKRLASQVERRSGVTLVEVLMSLMIMSIGVSAVAVLFPISVLRSVQATQLTNAAILMQNARTALDMRPELVFDPDGDGNFQEHIGARKELKYIIDPSGYFAMTANGLSYGPSPSLSLNNNPAQPNADAQRGAVDWFGNLDLNADGIPEPFDFLPRYDGGIRFGTVSGARPNGLLPQGGDPEEARALQMLSSSLSKLGDAWDTQVDEFPIEFLFAGGTSGTTAGPGAAIVGVRFDTEVDLTVVPSSRSLVPRVGTSQLIADPEICRVVVFSVDGSNSLSLPLTEIVGQDVFWSEDSNGNGTGDALEDLNLNGVLDIRTLPQQFLVFNSTTNAFEFQIGRVLLQSTRTNDYNWLLTVRRGRDGSARGVDIVVTHNKGVTPADERLYPAALTAGSATVPMIAVGGLVEPGGDIAHPALRKGGYILDIANARWYRVQAYDEVKGITIGTDTGDGYLLRLETAVVEPSPVGKVMFLPGVIDVYPAGSLPLPANL